MIQYLFGLISQCLFSLLLSGKIIFQAVPKEYFCPFYAYIQVFYIYQHFSMHQMNVYVYISTSIISDTNYNNSNLYKTTGKDINIYLIVCKYIGNKIVEKCIKSFVSE